MEHKYEKTRGKRWTRLGREWGNVTPPLSLFPSSAPQKYPNRLRSAKLRGTTIKTLSHFFNLGQFVKCKRIFLQFLFSIKRRVRTFQVVHVVLHWMLKKCNKKGDMILLKIPIIFLLSRRHRRRSWLFIHSPIKKTTNVYISGKKMLKANVQVQKLLSLD